MPTENMNVKLLPRLSKKAQDYGFLLKLINMITGLDQTNKNLITLNENWLFLNQNFEKVSIFNSSIYNSINSLNSYVIHDIKHFIDDTISICWVLSQPAIVTDVEIDSIGKYKNNTADYHDFDKFNSFFDIVNDIENAYKHHISNNMSSLYGRDEPCIFALYAKGNKSFLNPELKGISLKVLVTEFNKFYKYSMNLIEAK